ncbi:MAG: radical SAM protein, partial [Myxococcales bacterium]
MLPKLLFATEQGTVLEHPHLRAVARSGDDVMLPDEAPIPMPGAGRLVHLPGRRPVGYDPDTGRVEVLDSIVVDGKRIRPNAVGALMPPGYTRTFLPAEKREGGPVLSQ